MIKKIFLIALFAFIWTTAISPATSYAGQYDRQLSSAEKKSLCNQIKSIHAQKASSSENKTASLGGGIIPDAVLASIYQSTKKISDSVAIVMVLGQALTCNAIHANKQNVTIFGMNLLSYPNIPVWLCGVIIFFFGFMLTLSITFYLVDIAFKLGFAVIMLPIGVALWPFPATKDKLSILISIILKSAGIFIFLAMTVAYSLNLIGEAGGGLEDIFARIDRNETDTVAESFSLATSNFAIVLFALVYAMKLIGSTIEDYVDKFFKDGAFGSASPIHGSMTQAMDFAKKKALDPVASWAEDVAKTQTGRLTSGAGKLMTGQYNDQLRHAGHYMANPGEALDKGLQKAGKAAAAVTGGTAKLANAALVGGVGRVVLGKKASKDLKEKINSQIEDKVEGSINKMAQIAGAGVNAGISSVTDRVKQSKAGQGIKKGANAVTMAGQVTKEAISTGYHKTLDGLDRASEGINNLKEKWHQAVDRGIADSPDDTGGVKLAKKALRSVVKAPSGLIAGTANIPVKVVKLAVKATNVNSWGKLTGGVLQSVGEQMQRNYKSPQQRQAEAARKRAEEEEREREEEERKMWGE